MRELATLALMTGVRATLEQAMSAVLPVLRLALRFLVEKSRLPAWSAFPVGRSGAATTTASPTKSPARAS